MDLAVPGVGGEHERQGTCMLLANPTTTEAANALGRQAAYPTLHGSTFLSYGCGSGAPRTVHLQALMAGGCKGVGESEIAAKHKIEVCPAQAPDRDLGEGADGCYAWHIE